MIVKALAGYTFQRSSDFRSLLSCIRTHIDGRDSEKGTPRGIFVTRNDGQPSRAASYPDDAHRRPLR
jgi:hypothetical protein